jgi:hypothetical protein
MAERVARIWFGTTALVAIVGLALEIAVSVPPAGGYFDSTPSRIFNLLFFFTIESNIIIAVTTLLLAIRIRRWSALFRYFWLAGIVSILITGIVYHAVLAKNAHFTGLGAVATQLLHTVVPVLALAGWLVFGPRNRFTWSLVALSLVHPAVFLVVTLARGAMIDWYPYPFLDATQLSYGRIAVNSVVLAILFVAFAVAATLTDRVILRRGSRKPTVQDRHNFPEVVAADHR